MKQTLTITALLLSLAAFSQNEILTNPGFYSNLTNPSDEARITQYRLDQASGSQKLLDSIYVWKWNNNSESWNLDTKTVQRKYNPLNSISSELFQFYDGSIWLNHSFATYSYDANNNCINSLIQVWGGGKWLNTYLYTSEYDSYNNKTGYLIQYWSGNEWLNSVKYIMMYDAKNILISKIVQSWNPGSNNFDNVSKTDYEYDENNKCVKEVIYGPSYNDAIWKITFQIVYSYNNEYLISQSIEQSWDGAFWINIIKKNNEYDIKNNLISSLQKIWSTSLSIWQSLNLSNYSYDNSNNLISITKKLWNANAEAFINQDSTYNYFHPITTKISESDKIEIVVSPNPTNGVFFLNTSIASGAIDQLEIFDISGRCIRSESNIKPQTTLKFDLSGLPKGLYMMKTRSGINTNIRKILVQ